MIAGTESAAVTVGVALQSAAARLLAAGIEAPRFEARLLLDHLLGGEGRSLTLGDRHLSEGERTRLDTMVARRCAREPMAHITGVREFWSLRFRVGPEVLTPRPDTETVVEAALDHLGAGRRGELLRILDLGVGSGCILLALLTELPRATGVGVDADPRALRCARDNARILGLSARARFVVGDWADALSGPFDVIVTNPPYVETGAIDGLDPEVACHEPRAALDGGVDGLACYRRLVDGLGRVAAKRAVVCLEVGRGQDGQVVSLVEGTGLAVVETRRDLGDVARVVVAAACNALDQR